MMGPRCALGLLLAGIAGCTVGPDYQRPPMDTPEAYREVATGPTAEADVIWWHGFQDPALNGLIETALATNRDIAVAMTGLAEAEALIRAERSDLLPGLDAFALSQHRTDFDGARSETNQAGLAFSFVPDLFGGQRRRLESARAYAESQHFTAEDVRRLTAAAVAALYVELRHAEARLMLLETSLELQNQTLAIVEARNLAGLSPDLDVQRASADLAQTAAQRGALQIARVQAENALAALLGDSTLDASAIHRERQANREIPGFSGGPPVGAPADLLRRRPDLRVAEANLKAAIAAIGVETADLYPAFGLPAELTADIGSGLSLADDMVGVLTAAVDVPLLDGGRRRAEIRAAEQRAQAALLIYQQTLIESISEVETALATIRNRAEQQAELARAVTASEEAYNQLDSLYREGLSTFIDILDAQRTLISSREAYVNSEAQLANAYIDLYTALGAPAPLQATADGSGPAPSS